MNPIPHKQRPIAGMSAFVVVWIGQMVSILATQMTQFATTVWAYEKTGSVTALGLVAVFNSVPFLLISPLAGAMIDRYNRKLMMMISDLGAGAATVLLLVLQMMGVLKVWHLYLASAVTGLFIVPTVNGSNQAIWQSKVAPDVQGRVFSSRRLIAWISGSITPLLAGLLADRWLEPAMQTNSRLAQWWSPLVGTGPGAGMALLMGFMGLGTALVGALAYLFPVVRDAEILLPDHL